MTPFRGRRPLRSLSLFLPLVAVGCATPGGEPAVPVQPTPVTAAERPGLSEPALGDQAVIRRTAYGVPHIRAENLRAAGFAMGWVQVEDYGDDVVEGLVRARGEWSRHNGPRSIDADAAARLRYARALETYHLLDRSTRDVLEGFAAGVNRYIELHPETLPAWAAPVFTGYDVHARSIQAVSLGAVRTFMERLERTGDTPGEVAGGGEAAAGEALCPGERTSAGEDAGPGTVWARLALEQRNDHPDVGSNVWALGPERTTSGHAILLRNPHLSWDAGYYEAHVRVPGVIDFYGDFRLGGPFGIIGGFNDRLGWATTNNYPDLEEIYAFAADPDRADHYILDGASLPIRREEVTLEARCGDETIAETRTFERTPFGPVFHRDEDRIYVLRGAQDGMYLHGEQFLRMMRARSLEEWKDAVRLRAHPSSNFTYADADGNIFYVWNATIHDLPHASGGDTAAVAVAATDEIGVRIVDFDSLPQLLNPPGGYLRNENDEFHYTNLNAVLGADDFPPHYPEPRLRLRSQLSLQLIGGRDVLSLEDVVARKHDMRMLLADRVKDDLVEAVRAEAPTGEVADAIELLARWDNTVARDSRGGVLFKTWWWRYLAGGEDAPGTPASAGFDATAASLFAEPWSPDRPLATPRGLADPERAAGAFRWAVEEAERRYGGWDVAWGQVHRARIGDVDVPVGGCSGLLGCFRVLWYVDHEEDPERLQVRGGDGWVLAVEFGDVPRAYSVLAYGQSDRPDSPHFSDQLELFADNRMKPVAFTEEAIRAGTIREYRPGR